MTRLLKEAANIVLWAVVILVALWSVGAAAGVVYVGFRMIAGV